MEHDLRGYVYALVGLMVICAGIWGMAQPGNTQYEYEVKSEQISDPDRLNESDIVQYESLEGPEKDALFRAYKKSDHFLGGASAEIETQESLDLDEKWRVIEIKGVPVLVGFHGPETWEAMTLTNGAGMLGGFGGFFLGLYGLTRLEILEA